jgi:hypothetical protein
MVVSFVGLRRAIGICGLLLPLLLGPVGLLLFHIPIQDSLSAYVHTPLRDVFVGLCFSLAAFFLCYRGHDRLENWTANLAAVFAFGLALCPIDPGHDPLAQRSVLGILHSVAGGGFFLTMSVYALLHFPRTPEADRPGPETFPRRLRFPASGDEPHQRTRNLIYRSCGIVIFLSMLAMGAYLLLLPRFAPDWKILADRFNALFWLECVAVWAFAAAWLTKGRAILTDLTVDLLAQAQVKLKRPASENTKT